MNFPDALLWPHDFALQEIVELYPTLARAEEALAQAVADKPAWLNTLGLAALDLGGIAPTVTILRAPLSSHGHPSDPPTRVT